MKPYTDQNRQLVLVGHDMGQDIDYLKQVSFDVEKMNNLMGHCDSKIVHQAWKDVTSGRSLRAVLGDLDIESKHLHNAGNDAAYALRALIGVAVEELRERKLEAQGIDFAPASHEDDHEPIAEVRVGYLSWSWDGQV